MTPSSALSPPHYGGPDTPTGFREIRYDLRVGVGAALHTRVLADVGSWRLHRESGLLVGATGAASDIVGATIRMRYRPLPRLVPITLTTVHCEILWAGIPPEGPGLDLMPGSIARGFGYEADPRHREEGQEHFLITHEPDDAVWFRLRGFWRPRAPRWSPIYPLTLLGQSYASHGYLRALRRLTRNR
ncbi:DUF1990 family protein [Mycetocola saprophilus]|uniref:DUF1990 family protein n=1 Tax=Mycetocola saprophilus TaxID=76636 RepID=UPI0009DDBE5B|nr:DUF1990 family protein [Mycetocola saprophilus]